MLWKISSGPSFTEADKPQKFLHVALNMRTKGSLPSSSVDNDALPKAQILLNRLNFVLVASTPVPRFFFANVCVFSSQAPTAVPAAYASPDCITEGEESEKMRSKHEYGEVKTAAGN